jgi:hypothetical protein
VPAHPTLMSDRRALRAEQAGGLSPYRMLCACVHMVRTLVSGMRSADATGADARVLAARAALPGISMPRENSKRARQRVPLQLNDVQQGRAADYLAPFSLFERKTFGVRPQRLCANMVRV